MASSRRGRTTKSRKQSVGRVAETPARPAKRKPKQKVHPVYPDPNLKDWFFEFGFKPEDPMLVLRIRERTWVAARDQAIKLLCQAGHYGADRDNVRLADMNSDAAKELISKDIAGPVKY